MDKILDDRYRLVEKIGRGGMGEVYRAEDGLLKREVAIKILSFPGLESEVRDRLLHEAQTVARLNHPNIVAIYDVQDQGESPYIVMELVEGAPLRKADDRSFDENIETAQFICEALDHAHSHGVVHRDLKPENILLSSSRQAKLVDFGLARSIASQITHEGDIVGTVYYMAPELAMGQEFDGRVDLYSLGIILYEMVTGKLPFTGTDPVSVISQHLHAPPVPPKALNPSITTALNQLILDLMDKEPSARPADALEVNRRLEGVLLGKADDEATEFQSDELRLLDRIVRGRMVGRKHEISELRELWTRATDGDLSIVLISGEPGIGKSRLVRELSTWVEAGSELVLQGECFAETDMPYGPFVQILENGFAEDNSPATKLPGPVIADLITIAPSLNRRFPNTRRNPPLDPQSEQYRLYESVLAFLLEMGTDDSILVVMEDLHWADNSSLSLLRHLVRRTHKERVCFLGTYREIEIEQESSLYGLLADLNRLRLSRRMKLSRLDRNETKDLLETILGQEVSDSLLDSIFYETEGNPFFIEEVCKSLVEEGKLYQIDGRWSRVDSEDLLIPQSVRLVLQSRLKKIRPATREILQISAFLGREIKPELLVRATEYIDDQIAEALQEAERTQLILVERALNGPQHVFAHALIPGILRNEVTGSRRASLHQQAAVAIEAIYPEDFEALAYHYSEAGHDQLARRYFVRAANRAREVYAHEEALRAYTRALELTGDDLSDQYDLLSARAKTYDLIAEREKQLTDVHALVELAQQLDDPQRECDAYLYLADAYLVTDHSKARDPAGKAVELARSMNDSYREGQALRQLGDQAHRSYDYIQSRALLETAAARFRKTGFAAEAASCLSILSVVLSNLGENEASVRSAREAVDLSRRAGDRRGVGTSLRRLGINYLDQSNLEAAEIQLREALSIHRKIGDRSEECNDLNVLGVVLAKQKQADLAEETFSLSLEIADQIGSVTAILYAINNIALFHYRLRGEYESGISFLQSWLIKAQDYKDEFILGTVLLRMADMFAALGAYPDALGALQKAEPIANSLMGSHVQINLRSYRGLWKTFQGDWEGGLLDIDQALTEARSIGGRALVEAIPLICWSAALLWGSNKKEFPNAIRRAEQAINLLRGSSGSWVDSLGSALGVSARLHLTLSQGEDVAAEKAFSRAAEVLRLADVSPEVSSPQDYLSIYSFTLHAIGRGDEARPYLRMAYDWLVEVADKIKDPGLEKSWLEAVPENRALLAAWNDPEIEEN